MLNGWFIIAASMMIRCVSASTETVQHKRGYTVSDPNGNIVILTDNTCMENADALAEQADKLLPILQNEITAVVNTLSAIDGETDLHYDLPMSNCDTVTVYIIRTDL